MFQKCGGMGLNGFIFKKLDKDKNIREKKKLGVQVTSRLG
jgi:hypothetical protein